MRRLEDKVAIVTGGCSGIGLATVELFVAEGAKVVVGDISEDAGGRLQGRFAGNVAFFRTDVCDAAQVEALVASAVSRFGRLDVMFNNAGAGTDVVGIADLEPQHLDRALALLLRSVALGHTYAARQFIAQGGGGAIVSTASTAGLEGGWSTATYTIAKHGVIGIARQTVAELGKLGIRSNIICPGPVLTPIMASAMGVEAGLSDAFLHFLAETVGPGQPSGIFGQPSDVAQVVAFLASDAARFINGVVLPVDGGATAITMGNFASQLGDAAEAFRRMHTSG